MSRISLQSVQKKFDQAIAFYQKRQYDNALKLLDQVEFARPKFKQVHRYLGLILLELKRYGEAIPALKAAIDEEPCDAHLYFSLARTYFDFGKFEEAEACCTLGLRVDKTNADLHSLLGDCHWERGGHMIDLALLDYEEAISYDDTHSHSWCNLGVIHHQKGNLREACRCYKQAIRHNPAMVCALDNLQWACFRLGRHREGVKIIVRLWKKHPGYSFPFHPFFTTIRQTQPF